MISSYFTLSEIYLLDAFLLSLIRYAQPTQSLVSVELPFFKVRFNNLSINLINYQITCTMLLAKEIFCKLCLYLTLSSNDCKLLSSKGLVSSSSIVFVCGNYSGSCSFAFVA